MSYSTSARRRFVSISLRSSQPAASAGLPVTTTSAATTGTMRTAVATTHRSIYTSDSSWFRSAAMVAPNNTSASISTSMRRYNASKNPLLFRYDGQQLEKIQSFSKRPYSTTPPLAAIVETTETETAMAAAAGSPVQAAAKQQWRELLFGGLLAVTLTATLVLGFPQIPAQAAAPSATAEATSSGTSSNSSSTGPAHVTFRPSHKSSKNSNKNGVGSNGGGAVMLSTQPLGDASNKSNSNAQISPHPVSTSGRSPYDVSALMTQLGHNFIRLAGDCCFPRNDFKIFSHVQFCYVIVFRFLSAPFVAVA
jgi:hypothetical protein